MRSAIIAVFVDGPRMLTATGCSSRLWVASASGRTLWKSEGGTRQHLLRRIPDRGVQFNERIVGTAARAMRETG